ncbi:PAS domain-containing protein [Croceicoccus sp. F390]|uniref:histidine kinase n=1 Tax=Croceicoccus esteveae TaxID=3075597 RepID=A0ABU2ZNJ9_9SPHN|nr:PAS domain-containing protein [Croceicoccus sp. F390]MDT0577007.1 PAS domain-containing protein [Croceicoccus sp. F390]
MNAEPLMRRIAVYTPHGRDGAIASQLLAKMGHESVVATSLAQLCEIVEEDTGVVLATEEALAGPCLDRLAEIIARQPAWSDLPFIILTNGDAQTRSAQAVKTLDRLGNVVLLSRPLHAEDLLRAVASALKARQRQIDARRHMEKLQRRDEQLADSEKKFHAIVDSVDQMIWATRADGYHDFYNDRWYEFTGVPYDSTDGDAWTNIFHPEDQERTWSMWRKSLATGNPYQIEYRLRHHSGDYRWVLGRAQPVRDDAGNIVRWYGSCTDIDAQVRARQLLAQSHGKLASAVEERSAQLAEMMQERDRAWDLSLDLLGVVDTDTLMIEVNAAWQTALGWSPEDIIGHSFLEFTHPDDVEPTKKVFEGIFDDPLTTPYEFRMRHADGSYRRIDWTAMFSNGRVYASGRDVTEQRAQAQALEAAEQSLRQSQKLDTIGKLTGGVAHDFNNLLMAIRSSLELLQRRMLQDDERSIRFIRNAIHATERGASLTQRMLAFARKQELQASSVDIRQLMLGMTDLLARSIGPEIDLHVDAPKDLPDVWIDANQLEMAVLNLAINARDAMDGKGRLTLRLDQTKLGADDQVQPGPYVRIAVEDTGAGMDAETLACAMEPFFTTKGVGKGTGLGLPMVHGLTNQSGGTFRLQSTPGRGTTAEIYLPLCKASEQARMIQESKDDLDEHGANPSRKTVLVVDDDMLVLMGTAGLLEDLGHEVIEASSGSQALEIIEQRPEIELLITDHAMPKMTGVELAQKARQLRAALPVILASGYAEMPEGGEKWISTRLEKPFSDVMLRKAIEAVL